MKKVLLVLLCTLSAIAMNAMDSGKNITITKGQTIVLDLASDIGIVLNYPHTYIYSQKGGSGHYNELYTVSDATALSIIPIEHIYSSSFGGKYYTFQITPQKTGSYTLYQEFSLVQNSSYGSNNSFTYNINVVDVVNIIIPSHKYITTHCWCCCTYCWHVTSICCSYICTLSSSTTICIK